MVKWRIEIGAYIGPDLALQYMGGVAERFKALVSKTSSRIYISRSSYRGFESHLLRHINDGIRYL